MYEFGNGQQQHCLEKKVAKDKVRFKKIGKIGETTSRCEVVYSTSSFSFAAGTPLPMTSIVQMTPAAY